MWRIAILDDYQNVALRCADWNSLLPDFQVHTFVDHLSDEDALVSRLGDFEVLVAMRERTPFRRELLSRLPRLELLVTTGRTNSAIDVAAAKDLGITVCGTDGSGTSTAELTWGLILSLVRNISREEQALRNAHWQTTRLGVGLHGKKLGVIGLGKIGSQVAAVGLAFGMEVLAWSPRLTPEVAASKGCIYARLIDLISAADVITVHARLTESSIGLIGAAELARMKPAAVLVNTARAPLIDQSALVDVLHSGLIAGYAADVYETEPLPHQHPLLLAPNTVLTPHIGYVTEETYRMIYGQAVEDIRAFVSAEPIRLLT